MGANAGVIGIFLAAGRGARFAAASGGANKLLAQLASGERVIEAALAAHLAGVDECIAVVAHADAQEMQYLRRSFVRVIVAPDAVLGMGHSLAAGAREALYRFPTLTGVIVALADMPWVAAATTQVVAASLRDPLLQGRFSAVRPRVEGKLGHPVGFFAPHLSRLAELNGDAGAREALAHAPEKIYWLESDDGGCAADVDRPGDIV